MLKHFLLLFVLSIDLIIVYSINAWWVILSLLLVVFILNINCCSLPLVHGSMLFISLFSFSYYNIWGLWLDWGYQAGIISIFNLPSILQKNLDYFMTGATNYARILLVFVVFWTVRDMSGRGMCLLRKYLSGKYPSLADVSYGDKYVRKMYFLNLLHMYINNTFIVSVCWYLILFCFSLTL